MPDITHAREPRLLALDQLLARRSVGPLQEPAPQGADLDLILDAGLRAPDHGRLKPWRFVVIRGDAMLAYGEKLAEAATVRDPVNAAALAERYRAWVRRTPMLIAVGAVIKPGNIPEIEQLLAAGAAAHDALLWGARGMGKSSLVKAIHAAVRAEGHDLKIVELSREDLPSVQRLLTHLRQAPCRFILFCDDLSFSSDDQHYKSLKAVLDGGIEGRPENVLFYATSNRRHLMPREMIDNERASAITPGEAVEEKVSLSDRFGLWLGFHPCTQDDYLAMIR
eukprot:gene46694-62462_t